MVFAVFFGGGFDDLLNLENGFVGGEKGDVVGKPDVEERKILDVVGEKLCLELVGEEAADDEEDQRAGESQPAMIDRGGADAVVETAEAASAALFCGLLDGFCRAEKVVAEERDERH